MADLITVKDVAKKYKVETREVLYAARRQLIPGKKVGWIWTFDPAKLPKDWPVKSRGKR